jgi:hypothetical protein
MIDNPIIQFVIEFVRALLADELSERVRFGATRLARERRRNLRQIVIGIHGRNRKRLLHKLLTPGSAES